MDKKTQRIIDILAQKYPNPKSELNFENPFQLLVAVILSAQCTDKRVNKVTPILFKRASTPQELAQMPTEELESIIFSCGFYHSKAKHLKEMAQSLLDRYDGKVPGEIEQLRTLAGVGRKTANVVYAVGFGGQAIAVDTHVFRVSNRLGLAKAKDVLTVEKQLMQRIDGHLWADSHHYILLHGRYVCKSARPLCEQCPLKQDCDYYAERNGDTIEATD